MAKVIYEPAARKEFDKLPSRIKPRVLDIAKRLERWPRVSGAKSLRHGLKGRYRIRTGDYRVQFHVTSGSEGDVVRIEKLGHRDGFYD